MEKHYERPSIQQNLYSQQLDQNSNKKSQISFSNNLSMSTGRKKKLRSFRFNIMDQRRISIQNNRLLRRIEQINNRKKKNKLSLLYTAEDEYININKRARDACRLFKQKQIQLQNDNFVQRLVNRLHSYKSIVDNEEQRKNSKSKVKKKYSSFNLPAIGKN